MSALKKMIQATLRVVGVEIASSRHLAKMEHAVKLCHKFARADEDLRLLQALPDSHAGQLLRLLPKSRSEIRQDLFTLSELGFKRGGYFVEFGATNGIDMSNTYLLEKEFGWQGILAEPARCWHSSLKRNRGAPIETDCIWRSTGESLLFREAGGLSAIGTFSAIDPHGRGRKEISTYQVKTISLLDLLEKYHAPRDIDYLSIDTEGSEYEILSAFDFDRYTFKVITCEHNFSTKRQDIFELLSSNGYKRKFEEFSKFDDWYVGGS